MFLTYLFYRMAKNTLTLYVDDTSSRAYQLFLESDRRDATYLKPGLIAIEVDLTNTTIIKDNTREGLVLRLSNRNEFDRSISSIQHSTSNTIASNILSLPESSQLQRFLQRH